MPVRPGSTKMRFEAKWLRYRGSFHRIFIEIDISGEVPIRFGCRRIYRAELSLARMKIAARKAAASKRKRNEQLSQRQRSFQMRGD